MSTFRPNDGVEALPNRCMSIDDQSKVSPAAKTVYENKEKITRYKFFTKFAVLHGDAIYGRDRPLMRLANPFKSAAKGYGTERPTICGPP